MCKFDAPHYVDMKVSGQRRDSIHNHGSSATQWHTSAGCMRGCCSDLCFRVYGVAHPAWPLHAARVGASRNELQQRMKLRDQGRSTRRRSTQCLLISRSWKSPWHVMLNGSQTRESFRSIYFLNTRRGSFAIDLCNRSKTQVSYLCKRLLFLNLKGNVNPLGFWPMRHVPKPRVRAKRSLFRTSPPDLATRRASRIACQQCTREPIIETREIPIIPSRVLRALQNLARWSLVHCALYHCSTVANDLSKALAILSDNQFPFQLGTLPFTLLSPDWFLRAAQRDGVSLSIQILRDTFGHRICNANGTRRIVHLSHRE